MDIIIIFIYFKWSFEIYLTIAISNLRISSLECVIEYYLIIVVMYLCGKCCINHTPLGAVQMAKW